MTPKIWTLPVQTNQCHRTDHGLQSGSIRFEQQGRISKIWWWNYFREEKIWVKKGFCNKVVSGEWRWLQGQNSMGVHDWHPCRDAGLIGPFPVVSLRSTTGYNMWCLWHRVTPSLKLACQQATQNAVMGFKSAPFPWKVFDTQISAEAIVHLTDWKGIEETTPSELESCLTIIPG